MVILLTVTRKENVEHVVREKLVLKIFQIEWVSISPLLSTAMVLLEDVVAKQVPDFSRNSSIFLTWSPNYWRM